MRAGFGLLTTVQGLQLLKEAALTPPVDSTMVMVLANRTHIMTRFLHEREKIMFYPLSSAAQRLL